MAKQLRDRSFRGSSHLPTTTSLLSRVIVNLAALTLCRNKAHKFLISLFIKVCSFFLKFFARLSFPIGYTLLLLRYVTIEGTIFIAKKLLFHIFDFLL